MANPTTTTKLVTTTTKLVTKSTSALLTTLTNATTNPLEELKAEVETLKGDVDSHWLIYAGTLVFLMQAGFTLLEAGSVSAKNATNILFKNVLDACISAISFYFVGYAFAYGDPGNEFIGYSNFFLTAEDGSAGYKSFFFQWAFAATAATIVSGAVAERIKIPAYFIYSFVVTAIIYPVVVHWVWADAGFLCSWGAGVDFIIPDTMGLIDFAGSGVVHLTGGICALVGAIFAGPRVGRFPDKGICGCFTPGEPSPNKVAPLEPHNRVYATLGALLLWFGWYGFNAGSTLGIYEYGDIAGRVTVTTTLAAANGAIVSMCASLIMVKPRCRTFDVMAPLNGILAGLVSITANCHITTPESASAIGFWGGLIYVGSSFLLKKLRIDDPLDAFSVHGACGIWGVLAVGIFGHPEYICGDGTTDCINFYSQFAMQLIGVLCIIAWTAATSTVLFVILRFTKLLRPSVASEIRGLDFEHHRGYTGVIRYKQEEEATKEGYPGDDIKKGPSSRVTPHGPPSANLPVVNVTVQ